MANPTFRSNDPVANLLREAGEIEQAARAMMAVLKAIKTAADRETIIAGRHKRTEGQALIATVVAAITQAEAAGIKTE